MHYVYLLENIENKNWYIGFTENIKRRLFEHNNGRGGRTTRIGKSWKMIYCEVYLNKEDAVGREKFLKGGSGRKYLKKQLTHYLKNIE
ncbi:MAG: GIY-YIG nuclease family protein [Candidatus Pacebacteria bacterium]|nr:GIY-YIG nuclease family protein [Candidatus Paceibacterota bacterium]